MMFLDEFKPDISASNDCVISASELKKAFETIEQEWLFPNDGISAKKWR